MSIFNKRSQEEAPPAAAPPSNLVEPAKTEETPSSGVALKTPEPDGARLQAIIGRTVKINGQIYSKEDLYIDGDVEGTIELHENRLTIGPNGKVRSNITAHKVVILGSVQGGVAASDKLEVRKDARLVGDIKTARIVIEDGAYFKGTIDIVKPEPAKPSASSQPEPQVTPVAAGIPANSHSAAIGQ
jgi:cytoskeletal protein CcmA (bactofilin family)